MLQAYVQASLTSKHVRMVVVYCARVVVQLGVFICTNMIHDSPQASWFHNQITTESQQRIRIKYDTIDYAIPPQHIHNKLLL